MQVLVALVCGVVFSVGLALSGMTLPVKVRGFLDVTGNWDPTLAFVMGGAVLVYAAVYFLLVRRRQAPLLAQAFEIPTRQDIDWRLLLGSACFGVGWGTLRAVSRTCACVCGDGHRGAWRVLRRRGGGDVGVSRGGGKGGGMRGVFVGGREQFEVGKSL